MASTKKKPTKAKEAKPTGPISEARSVQGRVRNREPNGKELRAIAVANGEKIPRSMRTNDRISRGLLTRAGIARLADVEAVTVAKWQRQGLLEAERIDGVWYTPRAVAVAFVERRSRERELLARGSIIARAQLAGLPVTPGQIAAAAFALLRKGKSAIDLVEDLQVSPEDATRLVRQYSELRDSSLAPLVKAPHELCASCGDNQARFCGPCSDARASVISDIKSAESSPLTRPQPTDAGPATDAG